MSDIEVVIATLIATIIIFFVIFVPVIFGIILAKNWEYLLRKKSYWDVDITGIEPTILCMHCKRIANNKTMYCPNCGRAMKNYWDDNEGEY